MGNEWFFAGFLDNSNELSPLSEMVTVESRKGSDRPFVEVVGFSISAVFSRVFCR